MVSQTLLFLSKRIISSLRNQLQPIDESIIREQVLSTHNYDAPHFNTNFILSIAENILNFEMGTAQEAKVEKFSQLEELNSYKGFLPFHVRQLSWEIASGLNTTPIANQHSITIHILSMLSSYCWEDKLVLMLAGFSIIYGQLSLRKRVKTGLVQKLGHLKKSGPDNQKAVVDCICSAIELTKCLVELKQWPSYSPPQLPNSALPMATYWIATSLVNVTACAYASHFKVQSQLGELTTLIANILATFSPELAKKKAEESFEALRYALYHNSSNKLEVFKLMFNVKDDNEELFRWRVGLSDWNHKLTLLLITSGFDISNERIDFLNWFHAKSRPYIIWIPILENNASWSTEDEQQFEKLKQRMENLAWLNDPQKKLLPQFSRFVKDELFPEFQMGEEAIIVSLDQRGKIVHRNVMHMILTWSNNYIEKNTIGVQRLYNITPLIEKEVEEGTSGINRVIPEIDKMKSAFVGDVKKKINSWARMIEGRIQEEMKQSTPYDSERETHMWQQETTWSLNLIVAPQFGYYRSSEPINDWVQEGRYIFLFGGNDIKWVRKFTSKVREVGSETQLNIELVYIGKNKMIRAAIHKEKMSHCPLYHSNKVWWFWTRLRSMFLSRIHYLDVSNQLVKEGNNDEILQGLKKLLAYETKNSTIEGWALLSKGSEVVVCGHGIGMLRVMNDYKIWKKNIGPKGFGQAYKNHYEMLSVNKHSCCTLEYPITSNKIPENENCPEGSRGMHKFLTFTCCHGHDVDYDHQDE